MPLPFRITRIVLEDFKSIASCDIGLQPLTFLVGPNGAGKSNFLGAIQFIADLLATKDYFRRQRAIENRGLVRRALTTSKQAGIRLEFEFADGSCGHFAIRFRDDQDRSLLISQEECTVTIDAHTFYYRVREGQVQSNTRNLVKPASLHSPYLIRATAAKVFARVRRSLETMRIYNINPFVLDSDIWLRQFARAINGLDPREPLTAAGDNLSSLLTQLFAEHLDVIEHVESYMQLIIPGFDRFEIQLPADRQENVTDILRRNPYYFQRTEDPEKVLAFSLHAMSAGTVRALCVLLALFQTRAGKPFETLVVGIEEPEMGLHPAAAGVLRDCLRDASQTSQCLVTSHSPDLLDDNDIAPDSILAFVAENGVTRIAPMTDANRSLVRDRLFTPGELLRLNQMTPDDLQIANAGSKKPRIFDGATA